VRSGDRRIGELLTGARHVLGPGIAVPVAQLVPTRRVGVPARRNGRLRRCGLGDGRLRRDGRHDRFGVDDGFRFGLGRLGGGSPSCRLLVDRLLDGGIHLVINTTSGAEAIKDSFPIRRNALLKGIPYYTTLSAARAAVGAIADLRAGKTTVRSLQEYQNG